MNLGMKETQDTIWREDIPSHGKVTIRISENKQYWWAGEGWDWTDVQHRTLAPISERNSSSHWEVVRQYLIKNLLNAEEPEPKRYNELDRFIDLE